MMTKRKPKDWHEARRLRAWELKEQGWKQNQIAAALGVTEGAVSQWIHKAKAQGVGALYSHKRSGRKPRLSAEQLAKLPELLATGPGAYGFRGDVWTCPRVAAVIKREFGVTYTPQQVGNRLRKIGWSRQKPVQRASQRDEAEIAAWREEVWPELKKRLDEKGER